MGVKNEIRLQDPETWCLPGWEAQGTKLDSSGAKEIPGAASDEEEDKRREEKKASHRAL